MLDVHAVVEPYVGTPVIAELQVIVPVNTGDGVIVFVRAEL
jgi:hypothetical protein